MSGEMLFRSPLQICPGEQTLNNVAAQTVAKGSPGRLVRVRVTTAGTTACSVNKAATVGGIAAANLRENPGLDPRG